MKRFLLYKDYQSGLCNEVLSVELAVGLAHLTDRTLVYYGSVGEDRGVTAVPNQLWTSPPSRRDLVDNSRTPTILDLLDDLPVRTNTYPQFRASTLDGTSKIVDPGLRLVETAFVGRVKESEREELADFAGKRAILSDPAEDVLHLKDTNLGYYSRFFFEPTASLQSTLGRIAPRKPYADLAAAVCRDLGRFNGVHVRLNDFRKFLPYRGMDYPLEILKNLAANLPADELLVIATDESENAEFFAPITEHFRQHIFVDHLIMREYGGAFRALPYSDEVTLAWLSNLVLRGAQDFLGTPGSTFSGLIQRYVALAQAGRDLFAAPRAFKFTYPGSATMDVPFEDGLFLEMRPGRYSWTRLGWNMEEETKSWYREWPEAIPSNAKTEVQASRAKAEARPHFTMATSFKGAGVPPQIAAGRQNPQNIRAIERQLQEIACELMFGADRAELIGRLMKLGAPAAEARRIIETADGDPLIVNGRAMALVLRKRDWLLQAMERQQRLSPQAAVIDRRSALGRDEFLDRYYSRGRPVVLTGEMESWPAVRKWNADYLAARIGSVEVEYHAENGLRGRADTVGDRRRPMPFEEFVRSASRSEDDRVFMIANETAQNRTAAARLKSDLGSLDTILAPGTGGSVWIGSSGILTPLHHDLVNSVIAQVAGRNRFKIIAAGDIAKLYNYQSVLSEIRDLESADWDRARYPALEDATIFDVTIAPGEVLFMPLAWWYQVRSDGFGASVTFTNFRWPNDFYRSYPGR